MEQDLNGAMLSYRRLERTSRRTFQQLTGMNRHDFIELLERFKKVNQERDQKEANRTERKRKAGGGSKPLLKTVEDQLLFILVYLTVYPTQDLMGILFGGTQAWVCKWVYRLLPMIEKTLGYTAVLPLRSIATVEELKERCPEIEFLLDATERGIQRPKETERQKKCYSGKKKRHTIKNTILTEKSTGKVLYLGKTSCGSIHDKKLVDEEQLKFPEGSRVWDDLGYVGYHPKGVYVIQPRKKPRKGQLTYREKLRNKRISKKRICVEHSIGAIKRYRILKDIFRNRKDRADDQFMFVGTGLMNFKKSKRTLEKK